MIVSTFVAFVLGGQVVTDWPKALIARSLANQSEFGKRLTEALAPPLLPILPRASTSPLDLPIPTPSPAAGRSSNVQHFTPLTAEQTAAARRAAAEWNQLVDSIDKGEFETARPRLEQMVLAQPKNLFLVAVLMDLDLEMGDYKATLQVATPYIQRSQEGGILLRACLAAAMLGQPVLRGEKEFVQSYSSTNDPKDELMPLLPAGDTPEELAALAAHNLSSGHGPAQGVRFLKIALDLDPTNPLFAQEVGSCYIHTFHYSNAIAAMTPAVHRAKNLKILSVVLKAQLSWARTYLEKYGDGNPYWIVKKTPPSTAKQTGVINP